MGEWGQKDRKNIGDVIYVWTLEYLSSILPILSYDLWPNIPQKSGKTLISCLMGKIPYFRVFPLFGGIICQMILFSNFLSKFFNGKQNLV